MVAIRYKSITGGYGSERRGRGHSILQMRACIWRKNRLRRRRRRPKASGHLRPTDNDEAGARTLLFGRKDPPHTVFSTLLLTTTYLQEGHGRSW